MHSYIDYCVIVNKSNTIVKVIASICVNYGGMVYMCYTIAVVTENPRVVIQCCLQPF